MNKKNIGLLVDNLDTDLTFQIIKGAKIGAKSLNANLYLLPGRYIKPNMNDSRMKAYNYQFNTLFDLAGKVKFDVILILLGSIASTQNEIQKREFLAAYGDIPVVTMCCDLSGYSSVMPGNRKGLSTAIEHLIVDHGAKKLGMVAGPETNQDSIEREQAFRDVLKKYDLSVSEDQIVHGNFSNHCVDVVDNLLDKNPELDAIVFANDQMALAGYKVFEKRGLEVGRDILATGFDDDTFASSMEPALTTVSANGTDIGYNAILTAINYYKSGKEEHISSDSSVVIRKSCGCMYTSGKALLERCSKEQNSYGDSDLGLYGNYIFGNSKSSSLDEENQKLMKAFNECVRLIYSIGGKLFEKNTMEDADVKKLQLGIGKLFTLSEYQPNTVDRMMNVFRMLHYYFEIEMPVGADASLVSDMFFNIYKYVSEKSIQKISESNREIDAYSKNITSFREDSMKTAKTTEDRYRILFDYLRSVEMVNSAIYLYEIPLTHNDGDKWKVPDNLYLAAYDFNNTVECLSANKKKIATQDLFSNKTYRFEDSCTRVFVPLFIGELQYGFLICEMQPKYFEFYMRISGELNDAIECLFELEVNESNGYANTIAENSSNEGSIEFLPQIYTGNEFQHQIYKLFNKKSMQGLPAVMIFMDVDDLETIKDRFGTEEGTTIIHESATVLCDIFSEEGIVSHFKDNLFVVVLPVDIGIFERNYLPEFNEVKYRINESIETTYSIDINIGYFPLTMERDMDISEYLEKGETILYMKKRAKYK